MTVSDPDLVSVQQVRDLVRRSVEAQRRWATFSQAQIDAVIDAMAEAATAGAEPLARMAVEETGYGNVPDKIKKNKFSSEDVYRAIRPLQTVGILREDRENGVLEIAEPVGLVAAIIPSTNPTSTAIYKILISLKARNGVILSPHPSAKNCICATADIMTKAALKAGAPEGLIGCLTQVTAASTQELMRHRQVGVILATGGTGLVRAAYSSGKPAFGVGPGNVPAYIERTANVRKAVSDILTGKTFDNGTICSAEQAILAEEPLRDAVLQELREQEAYFLSAAEIEALSKLVLRPDTFLVNPKVVGRAAPVIAQMAGFKVPATTRVLVAELAGVGRDYPLSAEKLSPILAFYTVRNWQEGVELSNRLLEFGGLGHTIVIHSQNDSVIREFALRVRAYRVVVNSPAPHGSIGYSTRLFPAMTLGCGAVGGNITSDNIGPQHLMNIKRVGYEMRPVEPATVSRHPRALRAPAAAPAPAAAAPTPSPAPAASLPLPDRATIARVVERFLAEKGVPRPAGASAAAAPAPEVPPPPRVVDFVSENDVRAALERAEKIFISSRTILTPSARDLGYAQNVFIETAAPASGKGARPE
ncbi:MAG: acetaldehyde dehydrogenase (acetylating) [Acidobacteria bacterium]|nr:acetaldehyde dehydrogenase (acetylating) [Acidobacteriota bacterium]